MHSRRKDAPLNVGELGRLGRFLSQLTNPGTLSLEGMDGLFCALLTGPAWIVPTEYLPLLWGGPLLEEVVTFNVAQVNEIIWLLTRHWNSILSALDRGAVHRPLIVHGVENTILGRAWAQGFMRGANFVRVGWNELLSDETLSELHRIPRLAQVADPPLRRKDVHPQAASQKTLRWLGPAVADAYRFFLDRRLADRLIVDLSADVASRWLNSPDLPP